MKVRVVMVLDVEETVFDQNGVQEALTEAIEEFPWVIDVSIVDSSVIESGAANVVPDSRLMYHPDRLYDFDDLEDVVAFQGSIGHPLDLREVV